MEDARSKTNIVILDACRDNPFERSWSRSTKSSGLAFMNAPTGSLIAYATSPGTTASDGGGDNGLYTSAILNHIYEEDISILQMFQKVRREVREVSGGTQIPWESTSLEGDFYLRGPNAHVPLTTNRVTSNPVKSYPDSKGSANVVPAAIGTAHTIELAENNFVEKKTVAKPAGLSPQYFLSQTTRIRQGDSIYFNRFSSSSWQSGTIKQVRSNGYYLVQFENKRGSLRTEVVSKKNIILSRDKHMPLATMDLKLDDVVYFFTNYDKLISYGRITNIGQNGISIQNLYKNSDSHTVPLSAILIQNF
jgi:hypothetical protein